MDKSWIQLRTRGKPEYISRVKQFIEFAVHHMKSGTNKILCPWNRCNNYCYRPIDHVEDHLFAYGMVIGYSTWVHHGEEFRDVDYEKVHHDSSEEEVEVNDMNEILNDLQASTCDHDWQLEGETTNRGDDENCTLGGEQSKFTRLMRDIEQELYPGCRNFSKLSFIVKLLHLKTINNWSNKSFTLMLELMKEALPDGNTLPISHYEAKKVIRDLGLGYEKIHCCKNDCVLFWKEYKNEEVCPKCHTPRYAFDNGKSKKVPQKILRYFPLIPRLQRLFISNKTATDIRWHKDKCLDDGVLRHPADSEQWKLFDQMHNSFADESCNVRLGKASDIW